MTPFEEADGRLAGMHGYEPVRGDWSLRRGRETRDERAARAWEQWLRLAAAVAERGDA